MPCTSPALASAISLCHHWSWMYRLGPQTDTPERPISTKAHIQWRPQVFEIRRAMIPRRLAVSLCGEEPGETVER